MTEPASLRARFLKDGFVHLPSALDAETLRLAERAWQWSLDHPGPVAAHVYDERGFQLAPQGPDSERRAAAGATAGYVYQDLGNPTSVDVYTDLVTRPVFANLMQSLFTPEPEGADTPWAIYVGEQVFLMEGNLPGRKSWHQDLTGPDARGDHLVTCWMSFDPVAKDEGVNLVRGSHRGPVYESLIGGFEGEPLPDPEADSNRFEIVSFATEPGDLVVFHMATLHGTGPTVPERPRRTLAVRFLGPDSFPGRPPPRRGDDFARALYGTEKAAGQRKASIVKVL
jgi:hypothetical protein